MIRIYISNDPEVWGSVATQRDADALSHALADIVTTECHSRLIDVEVAVMPEPLPKNSFDHVDDADDRRLLEGDLAWINNALGGGVWAERAIESLRFDAALSGDN